MNMRLFYGPSITELALDAAAKAGDVMTDWRKQRLAELESGDPNWNASEILDAYAPDAERAMDLLGDFIAAALTPGDAGILKMRELRDKAIRHTLDVEQDKMMRGVI